MNILRRRVAHSSAENYATAPGGLGNNAEDFAQILGVGTVREDGTIEDKYLSATDVAGVSLAGVKALIRQNQELKQMVGELTQKVAELERSR